MSEPRLIEPLLSEHIMGEPISDRCGVRCCPAMHQQTEEKYMVKLLSIPASEKQLDALLLSGACKSKEDATRYFRELADEAVAEAELLQKLSRLEGFRAFDAWQVEPMEDGAGFDVYLLSPYAMTLERHLRRNCLTHLAAVNLGLDLCAALSVCRRNGWLYVDLKPENIFLTESHGCLIGDLGFIRLSSLKYASLPDKYRSAYTAPEVEDAYSALNTTMDIYAAGRILYQVYNNGMLPTDGEPLAPPEYADYEMSEIILKACAADPSQRWQDPQEMGQALVSYMQRNAVDDDPIIPPAIPVEPEVPAAEPLPQEDDLPDELPAEAAQAASEDVDVPIPAPAEEPADIPIVEEDVSDAPVSGDIVEEPSEIGEEPSEEMEQIVIEGFLFGDEPEDDVDLSELPDGEVSDEVSQMLAQADELIAHKAPDPVVAPEPIDVPIPDPILPEPEPEEPAQPQPMDEVSDEETEDEPADDLPPEAEEEDEPVPEEISNKPKRKLGWIIAAIALILVGVGAFFGGRYYYENEYLQHISSVTLENAEDWLVVTLDTKIDNALLTVTCTDTYGNKLTQKVVDNKATFTSLNSGATYKIAVTISGRHQLTGNTTASFTTPAKTTIVGFTGITGDSDGSVILNFSVQGPDASAWLVKYSAEGEPEQTAACTGHTAVVTGLTPGKLYTFRLVTQEDLYVVDGNTLAFTASNVICAQNLTIQGFLDGNLVAAWEVPEGETVDSWTVRCFNSSGVDLTFTVTEPQIAIAGLDITQGYTLDVMASGMTVSRWTAISAASVSMKDILLDDSVAGQLTVTWSYEGTAPVDGWSVIYTIDGSAPNIVKCEENTFTLTKLIPGAHYTFEFQFPTDVSVYGATSTSWDAPAAETFAGYGISAADISFRMCLAPEFDDWTWQDVPDDGFTSDFLLTDSAAFVLYLEKEYQTSPETVDATFVIREQSGAIISIANSQQSWTSMWYQGYCELNLPTLPTAAGTYTVEVYFNGALVTVEPIFFTVS